MAMIVQHNLSAMNANRNLGVTTSQQAKNTEKLSSGYRINRAADDAAGLAISEKMRGQIRGLNKASANAQDGISLIQTAEGALTETHSIIQRMRELAVQSASDTNTDDDRTQIQNEIDQLTQEVDRIANTTEFNTKKLLNGNVKGAVTEKEGSYTLEGTFSNSKVELDTDSLTDEDIRRLKLAGDSNVIRIEILQDGDGKDGDEGAVAATGGVGFYGGSAQADPTDADGWKEIGSRVTVLHKEGGTAADGGEAPFTPNVTFGGQSVSIDGWFGSCDDPEEGADPQSVKNIKLDESGGSVEIKIKNAGLLKAGDVITITFNQAVATEPAKTGKDALRLQIGANAGQEVALGINSMRTQDLDIANKETGKALDVSSQNGASLAVNAYDMAIQKVSTERAKMGAMQNRLEHTVANLDSAAENTQNSESRIRDTDMAAQMVEFSKSNILAQAGQSMLAQANQSTQGVLSLLG